MEPLTPSHPGLMLADWQYEGTHIGETTVIGEFALHPGPVLETLPAGHTNYTTVTRRTPIHATAPGPNSLDPRLHIFIQCPVYSLSWVNDPRHGPPPLPAPQYMTPKMEPTHPPYAKLPWQAPTTQSPERPLP